ncbi:MAG: TIGR00730 family Rossman fold protein [Bacteroidota bacterium]|nr:TIGR00730 family Rossman fold protein [Bacteroidota bacterium]
MKIKSLAVYCGSSSGTKTIYSETAHQLGTLLGQNKINMIYGGGNIGLMGITADACIAAGGHVTGVCPGFLIEREVGHHALDDLIVVNNMHERKIKMFELADAFAILPGGIGTLDEFFEILTWKQLGQHDKPIYIINVDRFYDPLLTMMQHMVTQGYLAEKNLELYEVVDGVENIML